MKKRKTEPDVSIVAALARIRNMFPELQIVVSIRDCGEETTTLSGETLEFSAQVGLNGKEFHADTMGEVVALVRAWRQKKGSGNSDE